ncbi:MAG: signal peptidase II [Alphaproteobacteria bacterium]|nr:signal peptidase II [Alphaproteobacteria bacterium]
MVRRGFCLVLIGLLALVDQISKWWVIEMFFRPRVFEVDGASASFPDWLTQLHQSQFPPALFEWFSVLNIVMVWNKGISFGVFAGDHDFIPILLSSVALIMVAGLLIWLWRTPHWLTSLPLSMICAGALANIWDRVRFGAVADFIDFHIGDWHYPAFNLADSLIVIGVLWLAFDGVILEAKRELKRLKIKKQEGLLHAKA